MAGSALIALVATYLFLSMEIRSPKDYDYVAVICTGLLGALYIFMASYDALLTNERAERMLRGNKEEK
ncbi:MAG: hypothetical protein AAB608_01095 [Patescibacteria group bacterium]